MDIMEKSEELQELKVKKPDDDKERKLSQKTTTEKAKWSNDIEFLCSCITLSVGLGNVWRFPFTALQYGGGTFVIPYTIIVFLVGKPLYYLEILLGQFSSKGCIKVYDMVPAVRGIGIGQCICTIVVLSIYASVMALTIRYFLASFGDPLPWSLCKIEWNTTCVDSSLKMGNFSGTNAKSSAELYFIKDVLKEANSSENGLGLPNWQLVICLIAAWCIIGLVLIKGIQSSGKAAYFLAIFPYIILIILLIRSATLEGAINGILYFIIPDLNKIFDAELWYAAVTQVFYALGICFGSIIMYSSYNRFDQNIYRDVNIITTMDYMTSLLAGLIIFGILGHLAHVMGIEDIQQVTTSFMGLAFIAYPETISKFDYIPQFFAIVFFLMLFSFCIGSNMGMANCILTTIRDRYPKIMCWKIVLAIVVFGIAIGIFYTTPGGQYLINLLDFYGASFVALILAIIELITVSWIYGVDRFCKDIEFMLKRRTGHYWRICWKFITPFIMISILLYFIATWKALTYQGQEYSTEMHIFGWCISLLGLLQLPIWMIYAIYKQTHETIIQKVKAAFKPNKNWGPCDQEIRESYEHFIAFWRSSKKL
ncbi:sodium-dependent nutrient amino acid transporter 1-like isoform X1 [Chironomus tepperi]|uniref:sodium-dependent nutrient amino acid transporter 1-like isoform X1 n=1 Tax=Chironomus tepperi TaxID=113505 RepID=UPI00391EE8F9